MKNTLFHQIYTFIVEVPDVNLGVKKKAPAGRFCKKYFLQNCQPGLLQVYLRLVRFVLGLFFAEMVGKTGCQHGQFAIFLAQAFVLKPDTEPAEL